MSITALPHPPRAVPSLVVAVSTDDVATVVSLRGEADLFTLPVLVEGLGRIVTDGDGPVVVDLADTVFIDTATARGLRRAAHALAAQDRAMTIRSPSRIAVRVLTVAGLAPLIVPGAPAAP